MACELAINAITSGQAASV